MNSLLLRCIALFILVVPLHLRGQWLDVSDTNDIWWEFEGYQYFESGHNLTIRHDSTSWSHFGSWQIGKSYKSFFGNSYSRELGIMTDTLLPYPINANDYFAVGPSYYCNGLVIEFTHKFETDSLIDGGIVEAMVDSMNWVNVIDLNYPADWGVWNFYDHQDSLAGGQFGFSGTQDQWITSRVGIVPSYPIKTNWFSFVAFRFRFISDSIQTPKDGWIIDNLRLWHICPPGSIREATSVDYSIEYTNGHCHIVFKEILRSSGSLHLYDLSGKTISEQYLEKGNHQFTISTEGLMDGLYGLYFHNDELVLREKIMVVSP